MKSVSNIRSHNSPSQSIEGDILTTVSRPFAHLECDPTRKFVSSHNGPLGRVSLPYTCTGVRAKRLTLEDQTAQDIGGDLP